jgi:phosphopantetheinyl transferase
MTLPRLLTRICSLAELTNPICASAAAWLTPAERETWSGLTNPQRRQAWLGGRMLAKRMILRHLPALRPAEIEIHSRDSLGRSTRPRVTVCGRLQPWALSIAHSARFVFVALSAAPGLAVGVDVTAGPEPNAAFRDTWFSPGERRWCESPGGATLWAIKEAVYKAVNRGEPFAPRRIEVFRTDNRYAFRWDGKAPSSVSTIEVGSFGGEITALVTVDSTCKETN